MKILFVPNLIVSALTDQDRANILEAAGPGARIVEVKDSASQRRELPDTDIIFGRVHADNFHLAKQIVYYHSIGAGVDNILTTELINHAVPLASEKGDVGIHLAEHAFANGIYRVEAHVRLGNVASERVLERLGFTRDGIKKRFLRHGEGRVDATLFSLRADDA